MSVRCACLVCREHGRLVSLGFEVEKSSPEDQLEPCCAALINQPSRSSTEPFRATPVRIAASETAFATFSATWGLKTPGMM